MSHQENDEPKEAIRRVFTEKMIEFCIHIKNDEFTHA